MDNIELKKPSQLEDIQEVRPSKKKLSPSPKNLKEETRNFSRLRYKGTLQQLKTQDKNQAQEGTSMLHIRQEIRQNEDKIKQL